MMHQLYLTQLLVVDRTRTLRAQADNRRRWLAGRRQDEAVTTLSKRAARRQEVATTRAA